MSDAISLTTPLKTEDTSKLRSGDRVLISGVIYTARGRGPQAHKGRHGGPGKSRLSTSRARVIFYVGPSPPPPGRVIGAAGPHHLLPHGRIRPVFHGKRPKGHDRARAKRNDEVKEAIREHKAVYFGAIGGAGALMAQCIKEAEVIAYPDLGAGGRAAASGGGHAGHLRERHDRRRPLPRGNSKIQEIGAPPRFSAGDRKGLALESGLWGRHLRQTRIKPICPGRFGPGTKAGKEK